MVVLECLGVRPVLFNGECVLKNCSEEEFKENICPVNNSLIKTQWLNNIIIFGEINFRYINLVTYLNGDFIALSSTNTPSPKRAFYGLKSNGRYLFKNNSEGTPFYYFNAIQ